MSIPSSGTGSKFVDGFSDQFPAGLRVLVVDDDPLCLRILEEMLRKCLYEVTKCNRAEIALTFLRDDKSGFDIVISDVHMPDMDGFKLLEHVGLEMDLPVIMMSADDSKDVVMKGVTHGACDYLIKPVRMEALKNIWQHVIRKKKHELKDKDHESMEDGERKLKFRDDVGYSSMENEGNRKNTRKRCDEEDEVEEKDDTSALKKPRTVWSDDLHQQFLAAVDRISHEKAVPKRILEEMNVPGLTRENVASHLQKYRIWLKRKYGAVSQRRYMGPPDANFGSISSFHGINFQALSSNQNLFPSLEALQSLGRSSNKLPISVMDQRHHLFRFESPVEQKSGNNIHQMNLLHGIPLNIKSNQLTNLNVQVTQPVYRALTPSECNGITVSTKQHLSSVGQPILLNGVAQGGTPNFSLNYEPPLYGNIFPNARNTEGSRGYFDDLHQYKTRGLQTVGSTIDTSSHHHHHHVLQGPPSSFAQPGGQNGNPNNGLPQNNPVVAENAPGVKFEALQDAARCPNNLTSQQFDSDDILSVLESGFGFDEYPFDNFLD